MTFELVWTEVADAQFQQLRTTAEAAFENRIKRGKKNASRQEGLFKQIAKTLQFLGENPRHRSLQTHEYSSIDHPWNRGEKVFEAYAQNRTPSAYRVFWCYGPEHEMLTIVAITPHP